MKSLFSIFFSLLCIPFPLSGQAMQQRSPSIAAPYVDQLSLMGHNQINGAHLMDVEVVGDRAYVLVGAYYGLETYDISDPANPARIQSTGPAAWGAKDYGDRLYVFQRQNGFQIYDISGSTPSLLGGYDPSGIHTLFENGVLLIDTLYVAAHQMGIQAFDVSNPSNPQYLMTIDLAENDCWDVEVYDMHLRPESLADNIGQPAVQPSGRQAVQLDQHHSRAGARPASRRRARPGR